MKSALLSPARLSERLLDLSPERLIAFSRLILAIFALAAISLDPTQPTLHPELTFAILIGYLAYATGYAAASFFLVPHFRVHLTTHLVDVLVFVTLMILVEGPTSPFFVLFTFALFTATLRWNWQGALATTITLVVLFVALHLLAPHLPGQPEEITRTIIRGGFLLVAGAILTYLGALRERARDRIAKLADWPAEAVCDQEIPPLEKTLAHAASVVQARRALVVWEATEEPYRYLAWHDHGGFHFEKLPPSENAVVAEDLADTTMLVLNAEMGTFRSRHSILVKRDNPLNRALVEAFSIKRAVVAPLRGGRLTGCIILMEIKRTSEDLLALAEIVASRVAGQIEHHMLHRELAEAAAARERMRLARDVHDSALQTLTAVGLQLEALKGTAGDKAKSALDDLQQVVATQQRKMRQFVMAFREPAKQAVELKPLIGSVLSEAAAQWRCAVSIEVNPPDLRIRGPLAGELSLMAMEAVANAVRHGQASRIDVMIASSESGLSVTIADDGAGTEAATATGDDSERILSPSPRSLSDRVKDLGGSVNFIRDERGVTVRIELPP